MSDSYEIDIVSESLRTQHLTDMMRDSLNTLGVDLRRDGLKETPKRWAEMMVKELCRPEVFVFTKFFNDQPKIDQMVVESNIPFYSLCPHHVLPFFGTATVAYIPVEWISGLSKLARVVDYYSRGLVTQEEITHSVLDRIVNELDPLGAAVTLRGRHLCMEMRGVEKPGTITSTTALQGVIKSDSGARLEYFHWVNSGGSL